MSVFHIQLIERSVSELFGKHPQWVICRVGTAWFIWRSYGLMTECTLGDLPKLG